MQCENGMYMYCGDCSGELGTRLGDGCVQCRYVELGTRLGDGCVQCRCVELVMVHHTIQGSDLLKLPPECNK